MAINEMVGGPPINTGGPAGMGRTTLVGSTRDFVLLFFLARGGWRHAHILAGQRGQGQVAEGIAIHGNRGAAHENFPFVAGRLDKGAANGNVGRKAFARRARLGPVHAVDHYSRAHDRHIVEGIDYHADKRVRNRYRGGPARGVG